VSVISFAPLPTLTTGVKDSEVNTGALVSVIARSSLFKERLLKVVIYPKW
jgi:hypothetical protein